MQAILENLFRTCKFHHVAQIHNHDIVGNVFHNAHVMRNEHVSQVELILQILHQVQNLCLNGNVKRGNRLIADDEFRV